MSEIEYVKGKLKPLNQAIVGGVPGNDEIAAEYLASHVLGQAIGDLELPIWADNWIHWYRDVVYEDYFIHDSTIYEIIKEDTDPYDDTYNAYPNIDGTINFEVRFYNGGCCLEEALAEAMKEMNK